MKTILRLRLGAEEILLHWRQEVGALHVTLSIEEKGRWVDLMLQLDGVPYRLTPPSAAETSGINGVEGTLANLGIDWIYQFDHGQNSAYISVEAKESHRVRHVLTAMALAVVLAAALRATAFPSSPWWRKGRGASLFSASSCRASCRTTPSRRWRGCPCMRN